MVMSGLCQSCVRVVSGLCQGYVRVVSGLHQGCIMVVSGSCQGLSRSTQLGLRSNLDSSLSVISLLDVILRLKIIFGLVILNVFFFLSQSV